MAQRVARSAALITALSGGWALYQGFYSVTTLLASTTIALLAIKELSQQQQRVERRSRSYSGSGRLESMKEPKLIQEVQSVASQNHLIPSQTDLIPFLPPPSPPPKRRPRLPSFPPSTPREIRLEMAESKR